MPAPARVPLFQLGRHLFARLHAISSILKAQLQCDKLRCNLSAWLQVVSLAASCQGSRNFSSSIADCQFGCNSPNQVRICQLSCTHSAQLQPFSSASKSTVQLHFVSSPAIGLLSCVLSHKVAQLCFPFHTVSLGSCAVGAGAKCSDVAALMIAGSSPRAVPGHGSCQFQYV